jgi:hypothetical protein
LDGLSQLNLENGRNNKVSLPTNSSSQDSVPQVICQSRGADRLLQVDSQGRGDEMSLVESYRLAARLKVISWFKTQESRQIRADSPRQFFDGTMQLNQHCLPTAVLTPQTRHQRHALLFFSSK